MLPHVCTISRQKVSGYRICLLSFYFYFVYKLQAPSKHFCRHPHLSRPLPGHFAASHIWRHHTCLSYICTLKPYLSTAYVFNPNLSSFFHPRTRSVPHPTTLHVPPTRAVGHTLLLSFPVKHVVFPITTPPGNHLILQLGFIINQFTNESSLSPC